MHSIIVILNVLPDQRLLIYIIYLLRLPNTEKMRVKFGTKTNLFSTKTLKPNALPTQFLIG